MAWASVIALAKQGDKTAGTSTTTGTIATAMSAGSVIVVAIAKDNVSTSDGATSEVISVVDSNGINVYIKAAEFCNGQNVSAAGATVSLWYSVLTDALGTGATLTVNFSSSVTACAVVSWGFTKGAGTRVNVAAIDTTAVDGNDLESQPATLSGLQSREYLFIRACAAELATFGFTQTTNYTPFETHTTTGGAADSNMAVAAEFRILTATGDTSDCGHGTGDHAAVYVALYESASIAFPTPLKTYLPLLMR